jgi:hypothetical protein
LSSSYDVAAALSFHKLLKLRNGDSRGAPDVQDANVAFVDEPVERRSPDSEQTGGVWNPQEERIGLAAGFDHVVRLRAPRTADRFHDLK